MGRFFSAYDLGFNVLMVRYNLRYYARYPDDPLAARGQSLVRSISAITSAVAALQPELPLELPGNSKPEAVRLQLYKLNEAIAADLLKQLTNELTVPANVHVAWTDLVRHARALIRPCPALLPWYDLGRAIARGILGVFRDDGDSDCPHFGKLVAAVRRLPASHAVKMPTLGAFRQECLADDAVLNPLEILRRVLREDSKVYLGHRFKLAKGRIDGTEEAQSIQADFDEAMPRIAFGHKLPKLEQLIRNELIKYDEAAPWIRVFTGKFPYAVRQGAVPVPLNNIEAEVLDLLIKACGATLSSTSMLEISEISEAATISRAVDSLNDKLGETVGRKKGPGGGYFLGKHVWPPTSSE